MRPSSSTLKEFVVGTPGWTADDLDDPEIERLWEQGRYEIVEGVLTEMPAAQYDSGEPLLNLLSILKSHVKRKKLGGGFAIETDVIVNKRRVAIVDAVYLTDADKAKQAVLYSAKPNRRPEIRFGRLMIPPTLIIESISIGHEAHDRETKFDWYAQAGVKNYWLFCAYRKSLECFVLGKGGYRIDAEGTGSDRLKPSLFPGLVISLGELWQ